MRAYDCVSVCMWVCVSVSVYVYVCIAFSMHRRRIPFQIFFFCCYLKEQNMKKCGYFEEMEGMSRLLPQRSLLQVETGFSFLVLEFSRPHPGFLAVCLEVTAEPSAEGSLSRRSRGCWHSEGQALQMREEKHWR